MLCCAGMDDDQTPTADARLHVATNRAAAAEDALAGALDMITERDKAIATACTSIRHLEQGREHMQGIQDRQVALLHSRAEQYASAQRDTARDCDALEHERDDARQQRDTAITAARVLEHERDELVKALAAASPGCP